MYIRKVRNYDNTNMGEIEILSIDMTPGFSCPCPHLIQIHIHRIHGSSKILDTIKVECSILWIPIETLQKGFGYIYMCV